MLSAKEDGDLEVEEEEEAEDGEEEEEDKIAKITDEF
jgi:hypothetical protein